MNYEIGDVVQVNTYLHYTCGKKERLLSKNSLSYGSNHEIRSFEIVGISPYGTAYLLNIIDSDICYFVDAKRDQRLIELYGVDVETQKSIVRVIDVYESGIVGLVKKTDKKQLRMF